MATYVYCATEEEVRQARREAEEIHQLDTDDTSVERSTERQQIERKFKGFLGELVLSRVNKWKRNRPHVLLFDAEDPEDGRKIDVKVRSKWFTEEIPVKPNSDLAVLLRYFKNEGQHPHWNATGQRCNEIGHHCFQVVKSFERSYLQRGVGKSSSQRNTGRHNSKTG
ncbi:MAG TPA: hypothetical protein VGS11_11855 [Candidatus Bathyarchaeia archaeon]|nr:hypothetical protein [Candidatus Bathyarchaeia archaeon]